MINKYLEFLNSYCLVRFSTALMSLVIEKKDLCKKSVLNLTTWPNSDRLNQSQPVSLSDFFFFIISGIFYLQTTQSSLKHLWTNWFRDFETLYLECMRQNIALCSEPKPRHPLSVCSDGTAAPGARAGTARVENHSENALIPSAFINAQRWET